MYKNILLNKDFNKLNLGTFIVAVRTPTLLSYFLVFFNFQEPSLVMSCCPPVQMMTVTLILEMKVMLESPRPTSTWSLWTWCGPSVEDIPGIRP